MTDDPELPPELRELEEHLHSLRPAPLSEDFRGRMCAVPPARRSRFVLWLTAAAILLGVATAAWVLTRPDLRPDGIARRHPGLEEARPIALAETPPTWLTYTRAAAESPDELERLLAEHDRCLLQSVPALEKNLPL